MQLLRRSTNLSTAASTLLWSFTPHGMYLTVWIVATKFCMCYAGLHRPGCQIPFMQVWSLQALDSRVQNSRRDSSQGPQAQGQCCHCQGQTAPSIVMLAKSILQHMKSPTLICRLMLTSTSLLARGLVYGGSPPSSGSLGASQSLALKSKSSVLSSSPVFPVRTVIKLYSWRFSVS